jgi:hypothetical protein
MSTRRDPPPTFLSRKWFIENGNNWKGVAAAVVVISLLFAIAWLAMR